MKTRGSGTHSEWEKTKKSKTGMYKTFVLILTYVKHRNLFPKGKWFMIMCKHQKRSHFLRTFLLLGKELEF